MLKLFNSISGRIASGYFVVATLGVILTIILVSVNGVVNKQLMKVKNELLPQLSAVSEARVSLERVQVAAFG